MLNRPSGDPATAGLLRRLFIFKPGGTSSYAAAIALIVCTIIVGEPCMAIEQAEYVVLESSPPFEVRNYDGGFVASVTMDGSRSDAVNRGFRVLANYIFGGNEKKSKIAMTAPVTQEPEAAAARTSAQPTSSSQTAWVIRFVMPAAHGADTLPTPSDARVHIEKSAARRAAAIRFSGFWSDKNLSSHEAELRDWMHNKGLPARSSPTYAYYDPPWTPWFLRRIEVLIDTDR